MNKSTLQRLADVAHSRMVAFLIDPRAVSTVEYALIVVAVVGIVGVGAAHPWGHVQRPCSTPWVAGSRAAWLHEVMGRA